MRRALSFVAAGLVALLVPLCLVATWAESQILDTDAYVRTVTPLASNREVLADVSAKLTTQIKQGLGLQAQLDRFLRGQPIAQAQIEKQVDEAISTAITRFLDSPQFRTLWVTANRKAHTQVVALLHGEDAGIVKNGRVVLDLTPLLPQVEQAVAAVAIPGLGPLPVPNIQLQYDLFDVGSLGPVKDAVDLLQKITPVLVVVTLGLVLAAILLHPRRLRGAGHALLAVGIGGGLLMAGIEGLRAVYGGRVATDVRNVSEQVYDTLTHDLFRDGAIAFGVGLVLGIGLLVASYVLKPSRSSKPARPRPQPDPA